MAASAGADCVRGVRRNRAEGALASAGPMARGGSHHSSLGQQLRWETGEGVRAVTLLRRALRVCLTPTSQRPSADLRGLEAPLEFFGMSLCTRVFNQPALGYTRRPLTPG